MNRKQLTILIVLGLVVGGLGFYLQKQKAESFKASDSTLGQKLLPDFPINDVAQVVIKHATNELNLVKQEDVWKVRERNHYPADFTAISEFLRKAWELKTVQNVPAGPSQLARLELTTPPDKGTNSGTLVEFKDKSGKAIKSLLLGKKYMRESQGSSPFGGGDWPAGRYVMAVGTPPKVWLISDPLSNIEPKPEPWLNKELFKVEKLRSVSVTFTNATNSWKLARETETGEWKLADKQEGEELDAAKIGGVGNALSSPSFNDVLARGAKPETTELDKSIVASLETFDNFAYTVKISGKTNEENYYLTMAVAVDLSKERTPGKEEKPEDKEKLDKEHKEKMDKLKEKLKKEKVFEPWTYLVSKWTIDPLLKERKDLLAEKKIEEPKKEEPAKDESKKEEPPKEEPKKDAKGDAKAEPKAEDKKPN